MRRGNAVDCGLWTVDCGLWTVDCGLWTVDFGLWTVDCGLWTLDCGLGLGPPGLPGILPKTSFFGVPIYLEHIPLIFENS